MAGTYIITTENHPGVFKNYAPFTGQPEVKGQVQPWIWSNVFGTMPCPPNNTATFVVAFVSTSSGSPQVEATIAISAKKNVTIGKVGDDLKVIEGSSISYIINE